MVLFYFNDDHVIHLRSESAVRRWINMVKDDYGDQIIPGDECGLNFLTFVLELKKNPGKNSTRKLIRSGIEPGPAGL